MRKYILLLLSIINGLNLVIGQDIFLGKWECNQEIDGTPVTMTIQIGEPEKGLLYPAHLTLRSQNFTGDYQLLLTKRNSRELVISKNKFAENENLFSLGNNLLYLNGSLQFSKDLKGNPKLTLSRLMEKKTGIQMNKIMTSTSEDRRTAETIITYLNHAEIVLKKIGDMIWDSPDAVKLLQPRNTPLYMGIIDTIFVKSKDATVIFENNKDDDIITIQNNGTSILDQVDSKKKRDNEEFLLDTGLNIITFFTDDMGNNPPSTASVSVQLDKAKYKLNFKDNENFGASAIALKVYCDYNKEDYAKFEQGPADLDIQKLYNSIAYRAPIQDSGLKRSGKLVGNIISHSQQLTFAIWDDAVEDGDTVSLNINGKWITQGFPVLKKPQFLTVTLQPGPNIITFIADNLGSIIPNTSVLEIIDGKKRKSFFIETDLHQNNLVNIFYDVKPE